MAIATSEWWDDVCSSHGCRGKIYGEKQCECLKRFTEWNTDRIAGCDTLVIKVLLHRRRVEVQRQTWLLRLCELPQLNRTTGVVVLHCRTGRSSKDFTTHTASPNTNKLHLNLRLSRHTHTHVPLGSDKNKKTHSLLLKASYAILY